MEKKLKCFLPNTEMASNSVQSQNVPLSNQHQHNFNLKMPVTTRSASKKLLAAATQTQTNPEPMEIRTNMRLRSGKVIPGLIQPITDPNVRDPTYKLSAVEQAKYMVRQKVKTRQREIAARHTDKAIKQVMDKFTTFIDLFDCPATQNASDPLMERIHIITEIYKYANSVSTHTFMHDRMMKLRGTMLKQCVSFSKDAKERIAKRMERVEPKYVRENEDYYNSKLDTMQHELDIFTNTYANRL